MRGKKYEFSQEQIDYIIANWGKESPHSMKKRFGCTWYAVCKVAESHGLELPTSNAWSDEQIEQLKELSSKYHYTEIAKIMNKTENAIYLKARKLNIPLIQDRRKWTVEEEETLEELWGKRSIELIAKQMKRTVFSLKVKAVRMGLGSMISNNYDVITVSDLIELLNVTRDRITITWVNHGLDLKQKKLTDNKKYYYVTWKELWRFLEENQNEWDSRYLDKNILPKEPEWLIEKRERDLTSNPLLYRYWSDEEIKTCEELFMQNKTYEQIAQALNRSVIAVCYVLRKRGYSYKSPVYWQQEELDFLHKNYENMSYEEIGRYIGRTTKAVAAKAQELGYKRRIVEKWSNEEVAILKELAPQLYIGDIANILGKSKEAVISKATRMGIDYITLKKTWSTEELEYIKNNWGIIPVNEMARYLKVGRLAVQGQADAMNLPKLGNNPYKKWDEEQLATLRELSRTKTISELAKHFKTSNAAITTIAFKNDIKLRNSRFFWSQEDTEKLRQLAPQMNLPELAEVFGISSSAVRLHALRHNIEIKKHQKYAKFSWSDEEIKTLMQLVEEKKNVIEIAKIMDKNDTEIMKKAKELDLTIIPLRQSWWKDEEIEKLRELAKTKTLDEMVFELNRTSDAIENVARKHNIRLIPKRKRWTEEQHKQLEELVNSKKTAKEIAQILGRSESAIISQIHQRGLQIQVGNKRGWTQEDEEALEELWGIKSLDYIAKKLDRSISSLTNKANKLGLGPTMGNNYDGLLIPEICEAMQLSNNVVAISWVSLGLKVHTRKISKVKEYKYVKINDLWDFLEKNQNIWDSRKLKEGIFGSEPEWLAAKRQRDIDEDIQLGMLNLKRQKLFLAKQGILESQNKEENVKEEQKEPTRKYEKK